MPASASVRTASCPADAEGPSPSRAPSGGRVRKGAGYRGRTAGRAAARWAAPAAAAVRADHQAALAAIVANQSQLLADLNQGQAVLRDFVRAAALNYSGGLYLHGPPGTRKTCPVRGVLQAEGLVHGYRRGHLTPLGPLRPARGACSGSGGPRRRGSWLWFGAGAPAPPGCPRAEEGGGRHARLPTKCEAGSAPLTSRAASSASATGSCTAISYWRRSSRGPTSSTTPRPTTNSVP
jgi:hypothetical protein